MPTNVEAAAPMRARTVYDFITTYKATSKLTFAINTDLYQIGQYQATGVAGYAHYQFDDQWSVTPRLEYVDDKNNLAMGESFANGQRLLCYTLTVEDRLTPTLFLRFEGRYDQSTENVFTKDGAGRNTQSTGTVSLTTTF